MLGDESFRTIFWLLFAIVFIATHAFTTDASENNLIQNEIAEENDENIEDAEPDSRMTDEVVGFPGEIETVGPENGREIKNKEISPYLSFEYDDSSELVENDMQRDVVPGKNRHVYSLPARINARLNVHQLLEKKRREKPGKGAGDKLSGKENVNHEAAQKKKGSSKGNLVNKAAGRRQTKMLRSRYAHSPSWEGASYRLIRPKNVPPLFGPPPPPPPKPSIIGGLNVPSGSHPPLPGFKLEFKTQLTRNQRNRPDVADTSLSHVSIVADT
uniref:Proline-rich protein n=1 Tax=Timema bartmani TaxID=61472 RepID=A0A7R9I172_9NEOP|nr:unnamed protein product [Timema bartmani]